MSTTGATSTTGARRPVWTLVGVVVLPLLVLGMLLWALWSPQDRLDTVRAAIVNHDEPVQVDGQTVPLGRQLTAGLVSGGASADAPAGQAAAVRPAEGTTNYDWVITDSADASAGLKNGTYAAVVTIPEDFSAAATSFGGDAADARQATISVQTAPGGNVIDEALARIVTTTAAQTMGTTLTEQYVDGVLTGFTTLHDQLGQAADGAQQLADGAGQADDGAQQLADGAGQVATGADQLASGVGDLSTGARGLATGTGQSAAGAAQLAQGADQLADGVQGVADGASGLSTGLGALAAGVADLPAQTQQLATGAQGVSDGVAALVATNTKALQDAKAAAGCDATPTSPLCVGLDRQIADLQALAAGAAGVATGTSQLAAQSGTLAGGVQQSADGAAQLADGAAQAASGATGLASGAGDLAAGLQRLDAGADQLAAGVDRLGTGADQLASGTSGLASGAQDLAGGVGQLASGSTDLASGLGQAVDQVPTYSDSDRATLAPVVANPVAAPGVDDLGTGATGPLFAVVALWLGALALLVVLPPVPARTLGSTRGTLRLTLSALARPAGLGAVTGAVVGGVLAAVESADVLGWLALVGLGVLASVVFVALNQALAALLGNGGRAISLLVAVLVLATGVVATVPAALVSLRDLLPVGPALDAFTVVTDGAGGSVGADVALLLVWLVLSVLVTALVVRRRRSVRVAELLRA